MRRLLILGATLCVLACSAPLEIRSPGLLDVAPDAPMPRLFVPVVFDNRDTRDIALRDDPILIVRSIHTGGEVPVEMDPSPTDAPKSVPAGETLELTYDLWQLTNLYGRGVFRELRSAPEDLRFRIAVETDAGTIESEEWQGVRAAPRPAPEPSAGARL